jgi:transcriptional regulator, GntR family
VILLQWTFNNDRPIYIQLVENLKLFIISGTYKPGERLLSVRDLATLAKVNPNTMQKALTELEEVGLIYTERTNGKFVTEDNDLIQKCKEELAKEKTISYLSDMLKLGFSKKEAIKYLNKEDE